MKDRQKLKPIQVTRKEFKTQLKVAVLTQSISHFEVPLFRLCEKDSRIGFKVYYILPVKESIFDSDYQQTINWGEDMLTGYASEQCDSIEELWQEARRWQVDVMLLYGYAWKGAPSLIIKNRLLNIPQIHRGTLNYYLDPRRPVKARLMRPFRKLLLRMFHAHHYGGDYSRQVLQMAGISTQAMFFVPYSVDSNYFINEADSADVKEAAQSLKDSLGWSKDDHVLLYIAQHNWFKGPDIAMEVFRLWQERDKKARFLIVGSGRMTETLRQYASQHLDGNTYHFAGFVPSKETVKYYLACDIVLCTSRYETWARMINEAMLCQRPCIISTIVPAAGGLVDDGKNGIVVTDNQIENYVDAVLRYFSLTAAMRLEMQDEARSRANMFAYENYMDEFVAAVHYAISSKYHADISTE